MSHKAPPDPPRYWRSLEGREGGPAYQARVHAEQPPAAPELELTRRTFLGTMGASLALGGLTLSGCVRKPQEKILPYARRPEDLIPGKPRYFATSTLIGGSVMGLLVESQEGRPTKVEGNPQHPNSRGATNAWTQASVLDLYSPDRSKKPVKAGGGGADWNWKATLWKDVEAFFADQAARYRKSEGKGLAILVGETRSPTLVALLDEILKQYPQARLYRDDAAHPRNALAGAALVGMQDAVVLPAIDRAEVIVALDNDFLGAEGDVVRQSLHFADGRRVTTPADKMNRLYAVEPAFTITGAKADHRLQLRGSEVGSFLVGLAGELFRTGLSAASAEALVGKLGNPAEAYGRFIPALAKDLMAHQGRSLILVGERQPPWVHALAHLLNSALGSVGQTLSLTRHPGPRAASLVELAAAIRGKEVETLIMLGGNPAYDAPVDLELTTLIGQVPVSVHHSIYLNETSKLVSWHIPASHYLEAWGDFQATDGTASIQQPLIAPLFDTISEIELLAQLVGAPGKPPRTGYEIVRSRWAQSSVLDFESSWRRWLHDGVVAQPMSGHALNPNFSWASLPAAIPAKGEAQGLELTFQLDPSVYDGRYAGNAWLQELPDPITKLTWDNAALIGPTTAQRLDVANGDLIEITRNGRTLRIAVWVTPGVADDVVVLPLGYGRTAGAELARGAGFNTYLLRTSAAPHFAAGGISMKKLGRTYVLASTQDYGSLTPTTHEITGLVTPSDRQGFEERAILRETSLEAYRKDPHFVDAAEVIEKSKIKSLYTEPHAWKQTSGPIPQQWGMSIDLNACTGCNACTIACQAENNIGVVGKERVLVGRELHWIRMDRYFSGSVDEPRVSVQPMPCQQCENAPCETVCPVNATSHTPEGLNDMTYNRCIGTRYCSNNCPFKVRRFNYFNFSKENDEALPMLAMQRNPDVTVRFRGVMEKCTFCVQRINEAKIVAKRDGDGKVADKTIIPACAQSCPTRAIVFGDISDPKSEVSAKKRLDRDYTVLAELNTKPRTSYLAGLVNTNPELAPARGEPATAADKRGEHE